MKLSVSAYRAHASAHKKILSSAYQYNYGSTAPVPTCGSLPQFTVEESERRVGDGGEAVIEQGSSEDPGTGSLGQSLATSRDEDDDSSNNASSEGKSPGQSSREQEGRTRRRSIRMLKNQKSSHDSSSKKLISRDSAEDVNQKCYGTSGVTEAQTGAAGRRMSGSQNWSNVRAVMAYYCTLRKIKRTKSNQRWMKLRTTVQLSSAISTIQKKPPLKREDSFLKRFSTRQIPATQETVEDTGSEGGGGGGGVNGNPSSGRRRRRAPRPPRTVVNPDENFFFYWLWLLTGCVLYNLWTLIVRQSFPELQSLASNFWFACDCLTDAVFAADLAVQLRTGYLEQGLMVYDSRKLAGHYLNSRAFMFDLVSLTPLDLLQIRFGANPMLRFPRFFKVYRAVNCYYIVESRTVYPNFWRVINLIHILLILAHWFGCFYFLLSEAEGFQGDWVYPHRPGDYATLTRKYLGSLYWSTLTLTTIGDLPTPETNAEYVFTIVSYLIGVFIFATIVGQVGNVITNRNANRLEFERLLDGAKTYMRHHKVPGGMKRRVLRWYDYSWSRGRIQGGGDINTALGLLPDKLKTELALHVNLSVLKKVTIFQECQPEFLHDLVLKMKAYIFTPGDSICRKGEVAREMFIIADGILEVISETGRVLTTMKAGDFFGEIGILNLDGLNKRTADVRSVGYSELFSLSREDVLAAMKDYPEAQEILQTLGRKRLQEARNCSRKAKAEDDKMAAEAEDNSGPKRIVHKLRSDVKGLRNALRSKSRPSRRSQHGLGPEAIELRALGAAAAAVAGGTAPKGVLRRMPRVESDETHHAEDEGSGSADPGTCSKEEKVISPLGAGLPLLARLKLLKERQEREEKEAAKHRGLTIPQLSAPPSQPTPSTSTPSEPEVIGAGLPLLQRLLLLKAKEDRERNMMGPSTSGIEKATLSSNPPSSSDTISPSSLKSPLSPTVKTLSPMRKTSGSNSPGKSLSPTTKPSRKNSSGSSDSSSKPKVSFKDKIMKLQEDGTSVTQPLCKEKCESDKKVKTVDNKLPTVATSDNKNIIQSDSNQLTHSISIPVSVVNKIKSPAKAVGTTFRDKLKLLQGAAPAVKETPAPAVESVPNKVEPNNSRKINLDIKIFQPPESDVKVEESKSRSSKKPWSKLKKASILGDSKEPESSSVKEASSSKEISSSNETGSSKELGSIKESSSIKHTEQTSDSGVAKLEMSAKSIALSKLALGKSTQLSVASSLTIIPSPMCIVNTGDNNNVDLDNRNLDISSDSETAAQSSKDDKPSQSINKKNVDSVKNEVEIAKDKTSPKKGVGKQKSGLFSITKKNKSYASVEDLSPEYGTLPFVKKLKILNERQKLELLEQEVKKTRSSSLDCGDSIPSDLDILTRSNSEGSTMGRIKCNNISHLGDDSLSMDGSQPLLSPESNETLERRNLKSILKKLSFDSSVQDSPVFCPKEFKKLIRAPTIEGYAARHSKFAKSVTFNRDTLTSPPDSANQQKPLFPLSNPYQRLTNAQSGESSEKVDEIDDIWASDDEVLSPPINDNLMDIEQDIENHLPITDRPSLMGEMLADKQARELESIGSVLDPKYRYSTTGLEDLHPEEIRVPTEKPKLHLIAAVANQRKMFRGSIEEQEYFGEVLLGIKHVIQGHLHEVQGKFQDRFNNLEMEVRKRDEIITQLQSRIQELERVGLPVGGSGFVFSMTQQETEDRTVNDDLVSREIDVVTTLTASSGSDDISLDQGFMRGDSLDTVFTTSPPSVVTAEDDEDSDQLHDQSLSIASISQEEEDQEALRRIARAAMTLELERLAESHAIKAAEEGPPMDRRNIRRSSARSATDRPDATYSRQRAARLRERRSWEESSDQESMELQELPRSISPQLLGCEERALLSPDIHGISGTSTRRTKKSAHHFHLFGSHLDSTRAKIKKTLSVDTGIHHTGTAKGGGGPASEHEHRKFSLGSFFGYHRGVSGKHGALPSRSVRQETVVLDMGSEYASSDGNSSSTSSSGESDYLPRTPMFENFQSSGASGAGDWEVVMLAEELERRERKEARKARGTHSRRSGDSHILRSLEEESDVQMTPQHHQAPSFDETRHENSPHRLQKTGSFSGCSSTSSLTRPDWLTRRSRGLILRASSLENQETPRSPPGLACKSNSTDGHKRL